MAMVDKNKLVKGAMDLIREEMQKSEQHELYIKGVLVGTHIEPKVNKDAIKDICHLLYLSGAITARQQKLLIHIIHRNYNEMGVDKNIAKSAIVRTFTN